MQLFETSITRTRTVVETCTVEMLAMSKESAMRLSQAMLDGGEFVEWQVDRDASLHDEDGTTPATFEAQPIQDSGPPCAHDFTDGDDPDAYFLLCAKCGLISEKVEDAPPSTENETV